MEEGKGQIKADTDSAAKLLAQQRGKNPKAELNEQTNTLRPNNFFRQGNIHPFITLRILLHNSATLDAYIHNV